MNIEDVLAKIDDVFAEMKDPNYEELKRMIRIAMSFLNFLDPGLRRRI
jgi:hypothetical protein